MRIAVAVSHCILLQATNDGKKGKRTVVVVIHFLRFPDTQSLLSIASPTMLCLFPKAAGNDRQGGGVRHCNQKQMKATNGIRTWTLLHQCCESRLCETKFF
jgi:hypothetical protein